jgi:hypothetical protein
MKGRCHEIGRYVTAVVVVVAGIFALPGSAVAPTTDVFSRVEQKLAFERSEDTATRPRKDGSRT